MLSREKLIKWGSPWGLEDSHVCFSSRDSWGDKRGALAKASNSYVDVFLIEFWGVEYRDIQDKDWVLSKKATQREELGKPLINKMWFCRGIGNRVF